MKKITLTMFLLILMMTTSVFATTNVTMEIVEDNVCTINLNDESSFEKKIIESDLTNHKVTLQLKITNNSKRIVPEGELIFVIDSSSSMNDIVEGEITRKDLVLDSANTLVKGLLEANPTSLKIGVVTFSSSSEKDDNGFLITGTAADAQKVCDLTNDVKTLTEKISSIEGSGQYTNLDSGLAIAKAQFSSSNTNKYLIVLTDGLPNLAVGHNDLVSYDGLTEIIAQTKSTLNSFENVEVITMLTGIDNEEATFRTDGTNIYTYGQVINNVFGTEETPTKGTFYKIDDSEIEQTITDKIYHDLLPVEKSLDNITIIDYIPEYIANNFNISLTDDSVELSATIAENKRTITWNIEKLSPGQSKTLKFNVVLKNEFDETIIDKILNTNEKVDITYTDFDGNEQDKTSDVTPKIRLLAEDVAPLPIPDAGSHLNAVVLMIAVGFTILLGYKYSKIK